MIDLNFCVVVQWFSDFVITHPGGFLKLGFLGPTARASDLVGLGRGLRVCISSQSPR